MLVADCLAMFDPDVTKEIVLRLQQQISRVLPCNELFLRQQAFNLVEHNLAFHVASNYMNMLVGPQALNVEASYSVLLDLLVLQYSDFLLRQIEEVH